MIRAEKIFNCNKKVKTTNIIVDGISEAKTSKIKDELKKLCHM